MREKDMNLLSSAIARKGDVRRNVRNGVGTLIEIQKPSSKFLSPFLFLFTNKSNKGKGETNMHKHEKLTKREKTIIGAAVVTTCIAGYFGIKCFSKNKSLGLHKDLARLEDSIDTLKAAMEETGRI